MRRALVFSLVFFSACARIGASQPTQSGAPVGVADVSKPDARDAEISKLKTEVDQLKVDRDRLQREAMMDLAREKDDDAAACARSTVGDAKKAIANYAVPTFSSSDDAQEYMDSADAELTGESYPARPVLNLPAKDEIICAHWKYGDRDQYTGKSCFNLFDLTER